MGRAVAYCMMAQSVLRFIGMLAPRHYGVLLAEPSAIAMVVGGPMHSMGAGIVGHLCTPDGLVDLRSSCCLGHPGVSLWPPTRRFRQSTQAADSIGVVLALRHAERRLLWRP